MLGFTSPFDYLTNYRIAVGKIYKMNDPGTIRANISVGLGYTTITEPNYWQGVGDVIIGSNYTWENHEYNTVSLIINPKIELPVTAYIGVTLSAMVQINKNRIFYGLGIGCMLGLLRKEEPHLAF